MSESTAPRKRTKIVAIGPDFVAVRDGVPFRLDGKERRPARGHGGGDLELYSAGSRYPDYICFGEFVGDGWEVVRPYNADASSDVIDPAVIAVLVKRSKRYRIALEAQSFIKENDHHEEDGPVRVRSIFRTMGGITIQPGGLSERDDERFPGRTARIHGHNDITLFLQEGEDEVRRRELMALTIATQLLQWEIYEDGFARGPVDLSLGDARQTHPEAHLFAAMLLVPQRYAARAVDIASAEAISAELRVDPCTVQDAHQLWDEITNPEHPRA